MAARAIVLESGIPGVFEARQLRSVRNRDGFINAGIEALNTMRFDDLKIADLAKASNNSVGSFYSRFQDKDAFFGALVAYAAAGIDSEFNARFTAEHLQTLTPGEALDALVDIVGDVFASRYRGVLREAYPRILDEDDPWAPIRTSALQTLKSLHDGLRYSFPDYDVQQTETRLSFCFQMVVGVVQNDLVNGYHVFTLTDGTILAGLKEALRAYMGVGPSKED